MDRPACVFRIVDCDRPVGMEGAEMIAAVPWSYVYQAPRTALVEREIAQQFIENWRPDFCSTLLSHNPRSRAGL